MYYVCVLTLFIYLNKRGFTYFLYSRVPRYPTHFPLAMGMRGVRRPILAMGLRACTLLNICVCSHSISARCAKVMRWPSWQDTNHIAAISEDAQSQVRFQVSPTKKSNTSIPSIPCSAEEARRKTPSFEQFDHSDLIERWLSPYEPEDTRSKLVGGIHFILPALQKQEGGGGPGTWVPGTNRHGAEEARGAHNSEVTRSKRVAGIHPLPVLQKLV